MAKLVLSMDGLVLKEIFLNKERLTIGRKPHNDVQIDNLAISGEHAAIVTILNDSFLEDLNSTNGTQVNGQTIKKHVLRNNDVIELGKYRLKYMADTDASIAPDVSGQQRSEVAKLRSTNLALEPAAYGRDSRFVAGAAARGDAVARMGVLQLLNGPNAGKELELTKGLTTLGKPGIQVAVIARRPLGYYITHIEGATPSLLNGMPLGAQATALNDHDVVEIAGIKMEFFLR